MFSSKYLKWLNFGNFTHLYLVHCCCFFSPKIYMKLTFIFWMPFETVHFMLSEKLKIIKVGLSKLKLRL